MVAAFQAAGESLMRLEELMRIIDYGARALKSETARLRAYCPGLTSMRMHGQAEQNLS